MLNLHNSNVEPPQFRYSLPFSDPIDHKWFETSKMNKYEYLKFLFLIF